jgi:citrate lyase subunit beta / citryl-CoA lyase
MPDPIRPRRSLLFVPGSNRGALEKARDLAADGLIFDLEDAVAPAANTAARANLVAALTAGGWGTRELVLRVNALATLWGEEDLALAASLPIDAVLLPKVESADGIVQALSRLNVVGAPARLAVWCMIETPLGVLQLREITAASPRLAALVVGTSDLTKDLRARPRRDRLPLVTALELVLLAARAHGLAARDGVQFDLDDEEGFASACRQGRDLGFDGKNPHSPQADRDRQRCLCSESGRGGVGAPHRRRASGGRGKRRRCGSRRRPAYREPACRGGPWRTRPRRGDRTYGGSPRRTRLR